MKALSLKQPWAQLVVDEEKTIEIRKWNTQFRGCFYIHASKTIDDQACTLFGLDKKDMITGAIIGSAKLVNVIKYTNENDFKNDEEFHLNPEFPDKGVAFGFVLTDIKKFDTPIPYKGMLNFFDAYIYKKCTM